MTRCLSGRRHGECKAGSLAKLGCRDCIASRVVPISLDEYLVPKYHRRPAALSRVGVRAKAKLVVEVNWSRYNDVSSLCGRASKKSGLRLLGSMLVLMLSPARPPSPRPPTSPQRRCILCRQALWVVWHSAPLKPGRWRSQCQSPQSGRDSRIPMTKTIVATKLSGSVGSLARRRKELKVREAALPN